MPTAAAIKTRPAAARRALPPALPIVRSDSCRRWSMASRIASTGRGARTRPSPATGRTATSSRAGMPRRMPALPPGHGSFGGFCRSSRGTQDRRGDDQTAAGRAALAEQRVGRRQADRDRATSAPAVYLLARGRKRRSVDCPGALTRVRERSSDWRARLESVGARTTATVRNTETSW